MRDTANPESKTPGSAMLASIDYSGVSAIAGDVSEIALDALMDDGTLRDIPIIGWLVGLAKTGASVRDALFARKVMHFLKEIGSITDNQKTSALRNLKHKENTDRIGETLFSFVERSENADKPKIMGKLFCALAKGSINVSDFWMLCTVVDRCPPFQLEDLSEYLSDESTRHANQSLGYICVSSGLGFFEDRISGLRFVCDESLAVVLIGAINGCAD